MNSKVQPIFLISLPRSGSTLLQKMLMSHDEIASHAEPWFLLPLIYGMKVGGIKTEYGQKQAYKALDNIYKSLSNHQSDYEEEIKNMALGVYKKLSGSKPLFLDKTPRYYLILEELHRIFPNAKFIYLYRNPASVFASMIEAFNHNSARRLDHLEMDLYIGPKKIVQSYNKHKDVSHFVSYESLVSSPNKTIKSLCQYLGVKYNESMLTDFVFQKIEGHGDELGAKKYNSLKNNSEKWKKIINTKYRRYRLKNYMEKVSESYLYTGGYDRNEIIKQISSLNCPNKYYEYLLGFEEVCIKLIKKIFRHKTMR